ncbi:restriction endonuclease subunit S [Pseudomonadota bacterium]
MGTEELWDIPQTWIWTRIKAIGNVVAGGTPSTKEPSYWGTEINWISPADLTGYYSKTIANGAKGLSSLGLKNSSAKVMPAGSVHFSSRAPIGYVAISSEPLATNQGFKSLIPAEGIFNEYVYYYLKASKQLAERRASGTTFLELSGTAFGLLPLPIPPTNEQYHIVTKIEALFSELDKGIESLKTAREQLKAYRQSVLKHAFEGKLTEQWRVSRSLPSWTETTIGEQLSYVTSGSRGWAKFYSDEGDIFIRAQNLKFDRLNLEDAAYVTLPARSEGMRTLVQHGDLLITITGANVTKTAFLKNDIGTAYVSQHVALARPKEGSNTEFLYWFLVAEAAGRSQLNEFAYGAGKPGLNLGNIKSVRIDLPDPSEQTEIVTKINEMLSIEESACTIIDAQLKRIEALRQSILRRAFSGRLVEQDPSDEPASLLLEKILRNKKSKKNEKEAA